MKRVIAITCLGTVGFLNWSVVPVQGQRFQPPGLLGEDRLPTPRAALQKGIEFHLRGEPEAAEPYLRQAETGRSQLSVSEQTRLDDYLRSNQESLAARRQALDQLQKVRDLVRKGQQRDADLLVAPLRSNKYLTAREKLEVDVLAEQTRQGSKPISPFTAGTRPAGAEFGPRLGPDALLNQARQAYQRGDLDKAEALAVESTQAGFSAVLPWSDTPDKVLRDVQLARAKKGVPTVAATPSQPGKAAPPPLLPDSRIERTALKGTPPTAPPTPEAMAHTPTRTNEDTSVAMLLRDARRRAAEGKLVEAEAMARRAQKQPGVRWTLTEDTPEKVLVDLARMKDSVQRDKAATLLAEARQMIAQKQYREAEKLTSQAEQLQATYPVWYQGDTPQRLRDEIDHKRQENLVAGLPPLLDSPPPLKGLRNNAPAVAVARTPSEELPKDPREEPPVIVAKTEEPPAPMPFPEPPGELPPDSQQPGVPEPSAKEQSAPVSQAVFTEKNSFEPPTEVPPPSERVEVPKADESEAILAAPKPAVRQAMATAMEIWQPLPLPKKTAPSTVIQPGMARQVLATSKGPAPSDALRQKAMALLTQARQCQRDGNLVEARAAALEARATGISFGPEDEQPDQVVAELEADCIKLIEAHFAAAQTFVTYGRYADAQAYFRDMRQLATVFGLETKAIEEQLAQLERQAAMPASRVDPPSKGRLLLVDADKELKQGNTAAARKLAEALLNGPYDLKAEAAKLLTQIDEKEQRRGAKGIEAFYELGVQAFLHKDYEGAMRYLENLDLRLLEERKRAHAREIVFTSREMLAPKKSRPTEVDPSQPAPTKD